MGVPFLEKEVRWISQWDPNIWVDVAAAALETRHRTCCLCWRGRRGSGKKDKVAGLHVLTRARSCSTLAGTEHLLGPRLILYIPVARPDLHSVTPLGLVFRTVST